MSRTVFMASLSGVYEVTRAACVAVALLLAAALPAAARFSDGQIAEIPQPQIVKRAGFDQKLNAQVPKDLTFRDETGKEVRLADYLGQGPVILSLAYYECPMLCTLVLNGMATCIKNLPFELGREYRVLTVSFNPREGAELARRKRDNYMKAYPIPGFAAGWNFLTGDEAPIQKLADTVGFSFAYDEKSGEYAHASGIMVLTPEGRVSHYFYGIDYPSSDVRLALVEASQGKIGSAVDQLLLLCYHYDPVAGKYGAAIMNFVRLGCGVTLVAMVGFVLTMLRREFRLRAARESAAG